MTEQEVSNLLARALCSEPDRKHVVPVGAKLLENLQEQERAFGMLLATLLLPRNRTLLEVRDGGAIDQLLRIAEDEYAKYKSRGGNWSLDECLSEGMKTEVERLNGAKMIGGNDEAHQG